MAKTVIDIKGQKFPNGAKIQNSCRFCPIGAGYNRVTYANKDSETELYYLCDKHLAEFDIEQDIFKNAK